MTSSIDNLLQPKLTKNQTELHELFVFFSVLGGMSVFGLLGIVLGPVVLAITLGLLETLKHEQDEAQKVPAKRTSPLVDLSSGISLWSGRTEDEMIRVWC